MESTNKIKSLLKTVFKNGQNEHTDFPKKKCALDTGAFGKGHSFLLEPFGLCVLRSQIPLSPATQRPSNGWEALHIARGCPFSLLQGW